MDAEALCDRREKRRGRRLFWLGMTGLVLALIGLGGLVAWAQETLPLREGWPAFAVAMGEVLLLAIWGAGVETIHKRSVRKPCPTRRCPEGSWCQMGVGLSRMGRWLGRGLLLLGVVLVVYHARAISGSLPAMNWTGIVAVGVTAVGFLALAAVIVLAVLKDMRG